MTDRFYKHIRPINKKRPYKTFLYVKDIDDDEEDFKKKQIAK